MVTGMQNMLQIIFGKTDGPCLSVAIGVAVASSRIREFKTGVLCPEYQDLKIA